MKFNLRYSTHRGNRFETCEGLSYLIPKTSFFLPVKTTSLISIVREIKWSFWQIYSRHFSKLDLWNFCFCSSRTAVYRMSFKKRWDKMARLRANYIIARLWMTWSHIKRHINLTGYKLNSTILLGWTRYTVYTNLPFMETNFREKNGFHTWLWVFIEELWVYITG
jgi:hypothetical protein